MPQLTEQQLPLPIVSETDLTIAEGVLYFGSAYTKLLREARKSLPARRAVCAWFPGLGQGAEGSVLSTGISDTRTLPRNPGVKDALPV